MQNKTFRLFVSSTFSDFKKERELLQTKIFPKIKKYAKERGYTFQPIDLRWGVSQEAQLDQKTLEICLSEVKNCKSYPHPNFLVMLGDRYGWVPLPYTIEENEFKILIEFMDNEDQEQIEEWYKLDTNEIPASYLLKERKGVFEDSKNWETKENKLRDILQHAVNNSSIDNNLSQKYFLSATEAEINKRLEDNGHLNYIFCFLKKGSNSKYKKVKALKEKIRTKLKQEYILEQNIIDLENFKKEIIKFLKKQIDAEIEKYKDSLASLEVELEAQKYFSEQKRENFLGQEAGLSTIEQYLENKNRNPLIIYGKSGTGKSALMAKAIEKAQKNEDIRVAYRFVGATEHSGSSIDILDSIMKELDLDIETSKSFDEFSQSIKDKFGTLENVVIFIDAVDQLENKDTFKWLPEKLPTNVKIVISALKDDNYESDSQYYEELANKSNYRYEIQPIGETEASNLLDKLLKKDERKVNKSQKKYFQEKYKLSPSPLFVVIASQIIKNWKSSCEVGNNITNVAYLKKENGLIISPSKYECTLSENEGNIIELFVSELSKKYYHNENFVKKVLGFLSASVDGLSESELLQLLSTDKNLIKELSLEEFHENHTNEIPLVHWSRLNAQLKTFLRPKIKDGEVLMCFFHREFNNFTYEKNEHDEILKAVENKIIATKDKKFDSTRWGKLHVTLIMEYVQKHKEITNTVGMVFETKMPKELFGFLTFLPSMPTEWQEEYLQCLETYKHYFENSIVGSLYNDEFIQYVLLEAYYNLYNKNQKRWCKEFCHTFIKVSNFNNSNEKKREYAKRGLILAKKCIDKNQIEIYAYALLNMIEHYPINQSENTKSFCEMHYSPEDAYKSLKEKVDKMKEDYHGENCSLKDYIESLQQLSDFNKCKIHKTEEIREFLKSKKISKFLKLEFEAIKSKLEKLFESNRVRWINEYMISLSELAYIYLDKKEYRELSILIDTVEKIKKIVHENETPTQNFGQEHYSKLLKQVSLFYRYSGQLKKALTIEKDTSILKDWAYQYQQNGESDKEIVVRKTILELEDKHPNKDMYLAACIYKLMKATFYNMQYADAIKLGEEALDIADKHYSILIK